MYGRSKILRLARVSSPAILAVVLVAVTPTDGNAQAWLQQTPGGTAPTTRVGHSAALDTNTQDMIVFGGLAGNTSSPVESNEVWLLQAGVTPQWVNKTSAISGTPPVARDSQAAAYDSNTATMIIFGGKNVLNSCFGDTWLLKNATSANPSWTQVAGGPSARFGASAVYDSVSNEMILFGGECGGTFYNDVWILKNANGAGTPSWTGPFSGAVTARAYHSAGYDPNTNTMTIFGGQNSSANLNDAWVLSNANGTGTGGSWTQLTPYGALPSIRYAQSTAYDPSLNRMMIFGGNSNGTLLDDAWVLYNANGMGATPTWVPLTFIGSVPGSRGEASLVYDSNSGNALLFGGGGSTPNFLNDVWTLQNAVGIGVNTWDGGRPGDERITGDFDGDGKDDFVVWRPSNGTWYIIPSSGKSPISSGSVIVQQWGLPGDIPVPADYDGDGLTDFAVWRPSTGTWFVLISTRLGTYPAPTILQQWGLPGDIPIVGDFDGDGKIDFTVFRPSTGTWYVLSSANTSTYPFPTILQQWGLPGDVPLAGDFDGDHRTDFTVFRPSTGTWFVLSSAHTGTYPFPTMMQQWGLPGDVPLVGDFDGDGKTDFTVWRPYGGTWFMLSSAHTGSYPIATIQQQWGLPGDVPVVGDFNGDKKADMTVWRPSSAQWFVLLTGGPNTYPNPNILQQWGLPGDVPF